MVRRAPLLPIGSLTTCTTISWPSCTSALIAGGECFGKAGAYAIQGRAGAFVSHLSGSFTGVMGLPLHETARLLRGFGLID